MKSKINKIIRSAAIATVGVLSLCSCNDFLTITPSDKTVLKDYWKTKDDVDQMVNGAYYKMLSGSIIERFIMWGDYRSDELQKYQSINNSTLDNISISTSIQVAITTPGLHSTMSSTPVTW